MATGDIDDFERRINENLFPVFGDNPPTIEALVAGFANTGATLLNEISYVDLQTRLQTATDTNLDVISQDFFGDLFPRVNGQSDDSYRTLLLALMYPLRATRPAMENVLTILTGNPPTIFEFWNPGDAGVYNLASTAYGISQYGGDLATWAYQCLIDVFVSNGNGLGFFSGYGENSCAYNTNGTLQFGGTWYGNEDLINDVITDSMIYTVIQKFKTDGTICWTRIHRGESPPALTAISDAFGNIITDSAGNIIYV